MNEKIKQLCEQAGITFTDYGSGEFLTEDDISLPRLEKFAELIVKECVKAIETNRKEPSEGYNTYNMGTFEAVDSIKQHFGVEE